MPIIKFRVVTYLISQLPEFLVAAAGAGDGWVINPSSFYETIAITTQLRFISILGGSGHSILNNYIGGSAPNALGTFVSTSGQFYGINLSVGTSGATSVQGNTIMNIRNSGATGSNSSAAININSGMANIGTVSGNTIGSSDTTLRIDFGGSSNAISSNSPALVNVSNNMINNIRLPFTTNLGFNGAFTGIAFTAGNNATSTCTISNNTIMNVISSSRSGSPIWRGQYLQVE
jgi:hypothetical protein